MYVCLCVCVCVCISEGAALLCLGGHIGCHCANAPRISSSSASLFHSTPISLSSAPCLLVIVTNVPYSVVEANIASRPVLIVCCGFLN